MATPSDLVPWQGFSQDITENGRQPLYLESSGRIFPPRGTAGCFADCIRLAQKRRDFVHSGVGRGCGVGRGLGVTLGVGVADGVGVGVGVGEGVETSSQVSLKTPLLS